VSSVMSVTSLLGPTVMGATIPYGTQIKKV